MHGGLYFSFSQKSVFLKHPNVYAYMPFKTNEDCNDPTQIDQCSYYHMTDTPTSVERVKKIS